MARPHLCHLILLFAVSFVIPSSIPGALSSVAGRGREFAFSFPAHQGQPSPDADNRPRLTLSLTGVRAGPTEVTVRVVSTNWSRALTLPGRRASVTVELPAGAEAVGSGLQNSTVLVTADQDVTVFALSDESAGGRGAGGFLVRPVSGLGLDYFVASYLPVQGEWSEFTVTATEDGTAVDVQLEAPAVFDGTPYGRQQLRVTLARWQTAQLRSAQDLTGTRVRASRPVSVVSGASAANVPAEFGRAGYLVEHLPPVSAWGSQYALPPAPASRASGSRCRVVAGCPMTMVRGFGDRVVLVAAGDSYEWDAPAGTPGTILSSMPVLVAQFTKGHEADGTSDGAAVGGPSMVVIPPVDLTGGRAALLSTPALPAGDYHIAVTVRCADKAGLTLDGAPLVADREFRHAELEGICTVQKRSRPAETGRVLSVGHAVSPGALLAVSAVVHGANMTGAYAISASLGADASECEAASLYGCCFMEDGLEVSSLSYDEEGSLSSSQYDMYNSLLGDSSDVANALEAWKVLNSAPPTPHQDLTTPAGTTVSPGYERGTDQKVAPSQAITPRLTPSTTNTSAGFTVTTRRPVTDPITAKPSPTVSPVTPGGPPTAQTNGSSPGTVFEASTASRPPGPTATEQESNSAAGPERATASRGPATGVTRMSAPPTASPTGIISTRQPARSVAATTDSQQTARASPSPTSSRLSPASITNPSGQPTTDVVIENPCTKCERPFQIVLYGSIAMATLLLLSMVACLMSIIRKKKTVRVKQKQSSGRWVAYPVGLSAEELSLGRLHLKPTLTDEPRAASPESDEEASVKLFGRSEASTFATARARDTPDDAAGELVQVRV